MVNNIKLVFGKKKQLKFVDESDFYKSLCLLVLLELVKHT